MMEIDIKYLNKTCRDDKICAFYIYTWREKKGERKAGRLGLNGRL